jgi:predicted enzyme related to lactoylglutathione lyase
MMPNAQAESPPDLFPHHATLMLWLDVADLTHARVTAAQFGGTVLVDDGTYLLVSDPNGLLIELWGPTSRVA